MIKQLNKPLLALMAGGIISVSCQAKPSDDPISPVEAVSLMGAGVVLEPHPHKEMPHPSGKCTTYRPIHTTHAKEAGFDHIRIRIHKADQTYELPLDQPYDEAYVQELEDMIDDMLAKDLAVLIAFRGPMAEKSVKYLKNYTRWWGMLAERFKDKSHRLMFNLYIEPGDLVGNAAVVYDSLTKEIRKTNPTRIIVYYKTPHRAIEENPVKLNAMHGSKYYRPSEHRLPESAGPYYIWDYHILKHDLIANRWKVRQSWQYMQSVKEVMWSGAWSAKGGDEHWQKAVLGQAVADALRNYGMSSSFLLMYGGGAENAIYNREAETWKDPDMVKSLTQGQSIWWNLIDNPGFNQETKDWTSTGCTIKSAGGIEESPYISVPAGKKITQDITLALQNNGTGEYDLLGSFYNTKGVMPQIAIKVTSDTGTQVFSPEPAKASTKKWFNLRTKISPSWEGNLKQAELIIKSNSSETRIDKLGLTRLFRTPVLDLARWPGEIDYPFEPTSQKKASKGTKLTTRIKVQIEAGNKEFLKIKEQIVERQKKIAKILQTIYPEYKYPHSDNPPRLRVIAENRRRKHPESKVLYSQIKELELQYRDWFIVNDKSYRDKFITVYGGIPPHLRDVDLKDTKMTDGEEAYGRLKADKKARKKAKAQAGPQYKTKTYEGRVVSMTKDTIVHINRRGKKEHTFTIDKNVKCFDYHGKPVSLAAAAKFNEAVITTDEKNPLHALEIKDVTIVTAKTSTKGKKPTSNSDKSTKKKKNKRRNNHVKAIHAQDYGKEIDGN